MAKKKDVFYTIGKRKRAIARAVVKSGSGKVYVNDRLIDVVEPEIARMMIQEPIVLAENVAKGLDFEVDVKGGGIFGQASAVRQAIARALVAKDKSLKEKFLNYDRTLLIADARRTEPHKPSRSRKGARRHKQKSKR